MATTEKYSKAAINEFYEWNGDIPYMQLIEWVIELMPQEDFDIFMADIHAALHEEEDISE